MGLLWRQTSITRPFEPITDNVIRCSLGAVKGTGRTGDCRHRASSPWQWSYTSLFDFCACGWTAPGGLV